MGGMLMPVLILMLELTIDADVRVGDSVAAG